MSETILDHGYIPEEHAPDPVIAHGDPTAPGKIGIWLFLASEIMFFVAILGTYVIIRAGSPELFASQAAVLSKWLAGINTLVLIFSSLTMALAVDAAQKNDRRLIRNLALTLLCAFGFLGIKAKEYADKAYHQTIVAHDSEAGGTVYVYDGETSTANGTVKLDGYRASLEKMAGGTSSFDIHLVSGQDVARASGATKKEEFNIPQSQIGTAITYGPAKSIFFACYFTLTGIHGVHVIGGIIPLGFLLIQSLRGKILPAHTEYVGLYWHFVDLIWIFLFPLLYLI